MTIDEAQVKFYELYDEWKSYHEAARELRSQVARAFSAVANVGKINPPIAVLDILESLEEKERILQSKMDELIQSLEEFAFRKCKLVTLFSILR